MKTLALFLIVTVATNFVFAREIRFWQGAKLKNVSLEKHHEYVAKVLAPATIAANIDALDFYAVYLPSVKPELLAQAELDEIPFTEAALPSYISKEAYQKNRAQRAQYSTIHSALDEELGDPAAFDPENPITSYSSTPYPFTEKDRKNGVRISMKQPRSEGSRYAYDLRPNIEEDPVWQDGTTLVWLQLKRKNVAKKKYVSELTSLFDAISSRNAKRLNSMVFGYYARVDEAHVQHYIRVERKSDIDAVRAILEDLAFEMTPSLLTYDLLTAHYLAPYEMNKEDPEKPNWLQSFKPGNAISVKFPVQKK